MSHPYSGNTVIMIAVYRTAVIRQMGIPFFTISLNSSPPTLIMVEAVTLAVGRQKPHMVLDMIKNMGPRGLAPKALQAMIAIGIKVQATGGFVINCASAHVTTNKINPNT